MKAASLVVCVFLVMVVLCIGTTDLTASLRTSATEGFYVEGTTLYDANGNPFTMRGINHIHAWYKDEMSTVIPAIASTGANTVRIALSDGSQYAKDGVRQVRSILNLCRDDGLVAVLGVFDDTGSNDVEAMNRAVDYWIEIKSVLIGREDSIIINVMNEWYGDWSGREWADAYKEAIPRMRSAGLNHAIMVDCAGWGQYPESIHQYGREILESDPLRNTMFSIHFYEVSGSDASTIKNNIDGVLDQDLCLVAGEFGPYRIVDGNVRDVDENFLMGYSKDRGVGWLAWTWYRPADNENAAIEQHFNMADDWSGGLTDWGERVVNGPDGIRDS
jgi:mannan endo-1,4-beta-mannosidase